MQREEVVNFFPFSNQVLHQFWYLFFYQLQVCTQIKIHSIGVKTVKIIEFHLIWGSPLVNSRYIAYFIGVTYNIHTTTKAFCDVVSHNSAFDIGIVWLMWKHYWTSLLFSEFRRLGLKLSKKENTFWRIIIFHIT